MTYIILLSTIISYFEMGKKRRERQKQLNEQTMKLQKRLDEQRLQRLEKTKRKRTRYEMESSITKQAHLKNTAYTIETEKTQKHLSKRARGLLRKRLKSNAPRKQENVLQQKPASLEKDIGCSGNDMICDEGPTIKRRRT